MSAGDFDLSALARYLHITEGQVARMTERGLLPGRKVRGEWRYNAAEIHHWLEDRIGAAADEDLAHMEGALTRAAEREGRRDEPASVGALLSPEAICLTLDARTRGSVIGEMIQLAARTGWLWIPEEMEAAVRERENLHSTALEIGVALLHPRRPLPDIIAQPFVCLGRTRGGIPFGHPQMTDLFFLIASADDAGHLRVLARLSRLLSTAGFADLLRTADDPHALHAAIVRREQEAFPEGAP